ncbi:MAG: hypothetical protein Q7S40_07900 [Opitutaceae bacterium]|nr:hypothetical protein [Opitutaceae bacterium]
MVRAATVFLIACVATAQAAELPLDAFRRVVVPPAKTSIYIGTVTMTMPPFVRANGTYSTAYTAKVFPFFFYNEQGTLTIEMPDESLRKLERGEPVDLKGVAVRTDGAQRRVEGRATPADAKSGKLKVRVFVSKRTELIFNTTYRFEGGSAR